MTRRRGLPVLFALCVLAPAARSQDAAVEPAPSAKPAQPAEKVLVSASEQRLWLARVRSDEALLSSRGAAGEFNAHAPFNDPLIAIEAVGDELYAITSDGSLYRYSDRWQRALDLPQHVRPRALTSNRRALYALIPSHAAVQLPQLRGEGLAATTQAFDPGDAELSIARYDGQSWSAVTACPPILTEDGEPRKTPRLLVDAGGIWIAWLIQPPRQVGLAQWDMVSETWRMAGTISVPDLSGFWLARLNRRPMLVAAQSGEGGGETLVLHALPEEDQAAAARRWTLDGHLSPLPEEAVPAEYLDAFGFNQHLGLLVADAAGRPYLQFARLAGAPVENTYDVAAEAKPDRPSALLQLFKAGVLVFLLVALFVFRRGSLSTAVKLPEGFSLAFTIHRLFGLLVDLLPFSLAAAFVLRVNWTDALGEMVVWAFPQAEDTGVPEAALGMWWLLSVGGYTLYCMLLELATGQTAGKRLSRLVVMAENGKRPAAWQTVLRNIFRLLELLPPFWILGFFVVLSRNRQRVGDLFARTVVVRRPPPTLKPDEPGE